MHWLLSSTASSLSSSTMSTLCPCALFAMSKSVETLNVTMISMPMASSTSLGNSLCLCYLSLLPHLGGVAKVYLSYMLSCCPWIVSKAGQVMSFNPSDRIFNSAIIEFHFILTACRGVASTVSFQGYRLKSVGGHLVSLKTRP